MTRDHWKPTDRQLTVLLAIHYMTLDRGFAPTQREIAEAFGVTLGPAFDYLNTLERKGMLIRIGGVGRSIFITPAGIDAVDKYALTINGIISGYKRVECLVNGNYPPPESASKHWEPKIDGQG